MAPIARVAQHSMQIGRWPVPLSLLTIVMRPATRSRRPTPPMSPARVLLAKAAQATRRGLGAARPSVGWGSERLPKKVFRAWLVHPVVPEAESMSRRLTVS